MVTIIWNGEGKGEEKGMGREAPNGNVSLPISVNPAGDTGTRPPPPKIGLRGTVMHYVLP